MPQNFFSLLSPPSLSFPLPKQVLRLVCTAGIISLAWCAILIPGKEEETRLISDASGENETAAIFLQVLRAFGWEWIAFLTTALFSLWGILRTAQLFSCLSH